MRTIGRKLAILLLIGNTGATAFAISGDGKGRKSPSRPLMKTVRPMAPGTFSLKSNYNFRGNTIFSTPETQYVNINTVVTYQKGQTAYIMPIKKKVLLNNRIVFNPNAATR